MVMVERGTSLRHDDGIDVSSAGQGELAGSGNAAADWPAEPLAANLPSAEQHLLEGGHPGHAIRPRDEVATFENGSGIPGLIVLDNLPSKMTISICVQLVNAL